LFCFFEANFDNAILNARSPRPAINPDTLGMGMAFSVADKAGSQTNAMIMAITKHTIPVIAPIIRARGNGDTDFTIFSSCHVKFLTLY